MKEWTEGERRSLRERVDGILAEHGYAPITSGDFSFALSREWSNFDADFGSTEENLVEDIAFRAIEWIDRDRRGYSPGRPERMVTLGGGKEFPSPPEGPSWWAEESGRRFERFREAQADALSLIEQATEHFLAVDELPTALGSLARDQRTGGDLFLLAVPVDRDEETAAFHLQDLHVWRGRATGSDMQESAEQPLWRLAELVSHLDAYTGCGEPEALVFLLCNEVPRIPWVDARYDALHGAITLSVRHPRVSGTDVATAYCSLRDAFFGKKRRGGEWPWLARRFCARLREGGKWRSYADAFALFRKQHEDQPYKNSASFYQAVHDLQKRLGGGT